jgi:phosphoadenosine phosphosulfate reductase
MIAEASLPPHDPDAVRAAAADLVARVTGLDGVTLLEAVLRTEFPGRIALVSSFGTESAVLLALAAEIDPAVPVLFLDTGKLFGETKRYRDGLAARLGLTDVRTLKPEPSEVAAVDHDDLLFHRDADTCCHVRKVVPLERALAGFAAWISGRKRYHGATRAELPVVEVDRAWIKINPLTNWSREQIEAEFQRRNLPAHPLEADGFLSVGCMPCSSRVAPGTDVRAGRWAGKDKTECGIHRPADGVLADGVSGIEPVQTAA